MTLFLSRVSLYALCAGCGHRVTTSPLRGFLSEDPAGNKMQHLVSQLGHESQNFTKFKEDVEHYRIEKLGTTAFASYFNPISNPTKDPNKANPNDYKSSANPIFADAEKLANYVYGGRMGNTTAGDGYKYIGGGAIHLTGKGMYQEFTNYYKEHFDATADFVANPGLLRTNTEIAVISALWYYDKKVTRRLNINQNTSVESVTKKINGGKNGLSHRQSLFNKAIQAILTC